MARGPATPPTGESRGRGEGGSERALDGSAQTPRVPGEPPPGDERYGPLAVLRTRKEDGRSLILYSALALARVGDDGGEGGTPERRG
jgi:hypothetical protein